MQRRLFSISAFGLWAVLFLLYIALIVVYDLPPWTIFIICCVPFLFLAITYPVLLFYGLLIAIPPSVEYAVTDSLGTDLPDEPLIALSCFVAVAGLHWRIGRGEKKPFHFLILALILQLGWQAVSVTNSTDVVVSIKFFIAKIWYLGAFVLLPMLILKDKQHLRRAALLFTGSMLVCTVWVLIKHIDAGLSFSTVNESVQPLFRNHVNYSVVLVSIIPIVVALAFSIKKREQQLPLASLVLILVAALYFSYARGAWLALLAGATAFWLLKNRLLLFGYVAAVIITLAAFFYLAHNERYEKYAIDYNTTVFHTQFDEHWAATYQMKDVSTAERFYRWIAGVRMVADNWQTGWGPNTFYPAYKEYGVPSFTTWVSANEERSTVHNYFLLTLIEQGIPGLLLLLFLLALAFYTVQKVYHRTTDAFWRIAVCVSGIILVQLCVVNFLSDLVETDKGGSLFYLCLAVIIIADVKTRTSKPAPYI